VFPDVEHALIHRARITSTKRSRETGTRNAQGVYEAAPFSGPWFPARRMTKRQSLETPEDGGQRRRAVTGYSLMWGTADEAGAPLTAPVASDRVEVEVRGAVETWEITGEPLAFDTGEVVFGGQAEIERVGDSA
jgi:hypothetical protein